MLNTKQIASNFDFIIFILCTSFYERPDEDHRNYTLSSRRKVIQLSPWVILSSSLFIRGDFVGLRSGPMITPSSSTFLLLLPWELVVMMASRWISFGFVMFGGMISQHDIFKPSIYLGGTLGTNGGL